MKPTRVTSSDESGKRQAIIDAGRRMNALGIDQGTSPAQQYPGRLQICKPLLLSKAEIEFVRRRMAGYGHADV
jgi:hypothetical protein